MSRLSASRSGRLGLCLLLLTALGCAGARHARAPEAVTTGAGECRDLRYRARYEGPATERRVSARLLIRDCRQGPLVFELRGKVGGAVVSGAADAGRLRLVFPRDRVVIDGPDDPRVWSEWLGLPITGEEWRRLVAGADPGELGDWRPVATGEAGHRAAEGRDGGRIDLWKLRERESSAPAIWPEAPAGFRRLEVTAEQPAGPDSGRSP